MLQKTGFPFRQVGVEQRQMDSDVRIGMHNVHKHVPHSDRDGQLLPALPDESLRRRLPRLHLASDEFPKQTPGLMGRALADHETISPPDERRRHLRHAPLPFPMPHYTAWRRESQRNTNKDRRIE